MSKALKRIVRKQKNDFFGDGGGDRQLQGCVTNYSEGSVLSQLVLRGWESNDAVFNLTVLNTTIKYKEN